MQGSASAAGLWVKCPPHARGAFFLAGLMRAVIYFSARLLADVSFDVLSAKIVA